MRVFGMIIGFFIGVETGMTSTLTIFMMVPVDSSKQR
jgi:TctA family transporter